jgi:UV DNA damage endonuclease
MSGEIRLGLCCINTKLREQKPPIFCSRTCVRKNFTVKKAKELALQNIKDLKKMMKWNYENNIFVLRLSSDMFPHYTDPEVESYDMDFASEEFKKTAKYIKKYKQTIQMHPAQFVQIGAEKEEVFKKSIKELEYHAKILDYLNVPSSEGILIIHGGGTYGNKIKTMKRWVENYGQLPKEVRSRIALEHCERQYSLRDVLKISQKIKKVYNENLPVIYDSHHYRCYKELHPNEKVGDPVKLFKHVIKSWEGRTRPIVTHISNQGCGKIGHHSDYITEFHNEFFEIVKKYSVDIDIEVEAKMKEQAILKLYEEKKIDFKKI